VLSVWANLLCKKRPTVQMPACMVQLEKKLSAERVAGRQQWV